MAGGALTLGFEDLDPVDFDFVERLWVARLSNWVTIVATGVAAVCVGAVDFPFC